MPDYASVGFSLVGTFQPAYLFVGMYREQSSSTQIYRLGIINHARAGDEVPENASQAFSANCRVRVSM